MQISRIGADMRSLLFNLTFPTMSSHCSLLKDEGCQPDDKNISSDAPTLLPDPATLPFPTNLFCSKVGVASLSRATERGEEMQKSAGLPTHFLKGCNQPSECQEKLI